MKWDMEISSKTCNNITINYGIINGNSQIFFIKAGQDGTVNGYKNKYLEMALNINKKYGCTVISSSNPFDGVNPLDDAMNIINDYTMKNNILDYNIYYLGTSNGGLLGAWFGFNYPKIKRMILVNPPLMYNYHKTKEGVLKFRGDRVTFVFGDKDPSIGYIGLLDRIINNKIKLEIIEGEDHHFSGNWSDFQELPENYLFYDFDKNLLNYEKR